MGSKWNTVGNGQKEMAGNLITSTSATDPAFGGRQVESSVPELIREAGMRLVTDRFVRQGFYPSRVLVAENATAHRRTARNGR